MKDDSEATELGVQEVVDANNQFAIDMYSEIKDGGENVFFSPYSISNGFAITYEGSRGETADEIKSVLHFPDDDIILRSSYARLHNMLNKPNDNYELSVANAFWAHEDYPFLEEYKDLIQKYYAAGIENLDFVGETEKSRVTINDWVEKQTRNKIKDLIPLGVLSSDTRFVITNAIYFRGFWTNKFDKSETKEEDFRLTSGETVKVPMMRLEDDDLEFNYTETDEAQVLELPYKGGDLSMVILLPKNDDIAGLESSLNSQKLEEWRSGFIGRTVYVYLPKFKFETKYFLKDILYEMGMPLAFGREADFSGMDGSQMLFIDKVIHQAFVEVDEEGTEAAAATAIIGALKAGPPSHIEFRADHPFIFLIQEKSTGNILFMGKVGNPS